MGHLDSRFGLDAWRADTEPEEGFATEDWLDSFSVTPSVRATTQYFWLVAAMFVAQVLPGIVTAHYAVEGHEPKFQVVGVNFLFYSLLVIVVGSFAGQWAAVHRLISDMTVNFRFRHQGYEFIDPGRFWQIYLFIGLLL